MKNVVFDLGAVVVDWNPDRLLREYPGDIALPVTLFEKGFFQNYWSEFDRGVLSQEEMAKSISTFATRPYEECWKLMEYIKHSLNDIPETVQLIRELSEQNYRLFCLSNMSLEYYNYMKDREVFGYFEGHVISALEHTIKPEKEIFEVLINRYGVLPHESIFIDDLEPNVAAAGRLGFHTLHFVDREKGLQHLREQLLSKD